LHIIAMDIIDTQWEIIKPLFDKKEAKTTKRGRPLQDTRAVLNGVLWILRTGAPWKDLPKRYPSYQTCHRRFQSWVKSGFFQELTKMLVNDLYKRGKIDIRETFIDGTFSPSKKGALLLALQNAGKAPKSWQFQTLLVFLSPQTWSALPLTRSRS